MIYVKKILHSKPKYSSFGNDIITLEMQYPKFIHSEFLTHRLFSRNSSSSRAIPIERHLEHYTPLYFKRNDKGFSQTDKLSESDNKLAIELWNGLYNFSRETATQLKNLNVHKQWYNRLIEPFSYIKPIVTATEWDNFINLRCTDYVQPEMKELCELIKIQIKDDTINIQYLDYDMFHTPYSKDNNIHESVVRCAKITYDNDIDIDINRIYNNLLKNNHLSPFEHVAKLSKNYMDIGYTHIDKIGNCWSGNFKNWIQYRQMLK